MHWVHPCVGLGRVTFCFILRVLGSVRFYQDGVPDFMLIFDKIVF